MKKNILARSLIGAPIGVSITTFISIAISLAHNEGVFYAIVPELISTCGNELNAVIVQTICAMLYGAVFAGASVIWDMEGWSLLRMTLTHLAVVSLSTLPIAWILMWMPHNIIGVALYFLIFFGIYAAIWLFQYSAMKKRILQWNEKIKEKTND